MQVVGQEVVTKHSCQKHKRLSMSGVACTTNKANFGENHIAMKNLNLVPHEHILTMSVLPRMYQHLKPVLQEMKAHGFQTLPLDYPGVAEACMLYQQASPDLRAELVATSLTPKELCTSIWDDTTMTFRTCLNTLTRCMYMLPCGAVFADLLTNTVVIARNDALYTLRLDELDEPDQHPTLLFTATCYLSDFCASPHGFLLFGDYMQAKVWLLDVASKHIFCIDLDFACYYYFAWLDKLDTNPTQTNFIPSLDTLGSSTQPLGTLDSSSKPLDTNSVPSLDTLHSSTQPLDTNSVPSLDTLDASTCCKQSLALLQVGTNKLTLQETRTVHTIASLTSTERVSQTH